MSQKLALLIGINYRGTDAQLNGCINDVYRMKDFLLKNCGYIERNIVVLTDDTYIKPTAMNILRQLGNLVVSAYNNNASELFIHYSGHGTYISDNSGDEKDGKDEALVPIDYQKSGLITDDLLHDYFSYLPEKCKAVCLFDCCHSGTMLDLKYRYLKTEDNLTENKNSSVNSNVITISGCKDVQTSADAFIKGDWAGAMTSAFLETMEKYEYNVTCFHLLGCIRKYLKQKGYEQVPQICSSKKLNNTSLFTCTEPLPEPYMILNN
jgi:hypothetical protein